jgi:hypothetical protein
MMGAVLIAGMKNTPLEQANLLGQSLLTSISRFSIKFTVDTNPLNSRKSGVIEGSSGLMKQNVVLKDKTNIEHK